MNLQLPLALHLNHQSTLTGFFWGKNLELKQQLEDLDGKNERFLYLWGPEGCGKSHLLQASCHALHQKNHSVIYLPLTFLAEWGAESVEDIGEQSLIAIDDIDAIAGRKEWEEALFHLYNRVRDNNTGRLLMAGRQPPSGSGIHLPDLRSRLAFSLTYQMHELDDELKITALCQRASQKGFELPQSVALFMLNRCARNMHSLLAMLESLDKASLAAKRRITVPFVKATMGI